MTLPSIGLIGRKRAGKDSVAMYLREHYGFQPIGFADPLRRMAARINPIVEVYGWDTIRYNDAIYAMSYDSAKETYAEVRRFLQVLGTEAVREVLGEDVWVDALLDRLQEGREYVVTDVRYPNEAQALIDRGFVMARVLRPATDDSGDLHPSETALDTTVGDVCIVNNGSLDDLWDEVERVVALIAP